MNHKTGFFVSLLFLLGAVTQTGFAQIPPTISYQGKLFDAGGTPLEGTHDLEFAIYNVASGGTVLWEELHEGVEVRNGVFNVVLGNGTPTPNPLDIAFDEPYWLGITVDGGTELSRIPLTSSAYGFTAKGVLGDANIFPSRGDVGIGTTIPQGKLEITGVNGSSNGFRLVAREGDGANMYFLANSGLVFDNYRSSDQRRLPILLQPSGGNVGIGTTNPQNRLHVTESSGLEATLRSVNSSATPGEGEFPPHGGPAGEFRITNTSNDRPALLAHTVGTGYAGNFYSRGGSAAWFQTGVSSGTAIIFGDSHGFGRLKAGSTAIVIATQSRTDAVTIKQSNGFIGIGKFDPVRNLDVAGEIGLSEVNVWDGTNANDLTWDGTRITREGSSHRYKKNIVPMQEDFHKILDLKPRQFQMKEGFGPADKWLFGYIAEDVDEIGLTKLVNYDAAGRPDGIKYKKISIYVLEIVKEQQNRIKQLEAENEQFKESLLAFEERFDKLEKMSLGLNRVKLSKLMPDKDARR